MRAIKVFELYHLDVSLWRDVPLSSATAQEFLAFYQAAKDAGKLTHVASIRAAGLSDVFRLSNTVEMPWCEAADIAMHVAGGARSTSVGDLVVTGGVAHRVASLGFEPVEGLVIGEPSPRRGFALVHATDGVFLGTAMGLAFWSNLDPVGQEAAVLFPSEQEAAEFVSTWTLGGMTEQQKASFLGALRVYEVEADAFNGTAASIAACAKAGLPAWDPAVEEDLAPTLH